MQNADFFDWFVDHVLLWLVIWSLGAVGQMAFEYYNKNHPDKPISKDVTEVINVKWYFRPLFGLPPITGAVSLRCGMIQIVAIVCAVAGLLISPYLTTKQTQSLYTILFVGFFISVGVLGGILNKRISEHISD